MICLLTVWLVDDLDVIGVYWWQQYTDDLVRTAGHIPQKPIGYHWVSPPHMMEADLQLLNHSLNSAWQLAQDRERWKQLVETAKLQSGACPRWWWYVIRFQFIVSLIMKYFGAVKFLKLW